MNMFEMMNQARKLKKEMARHQKELASKIFEEQSGGGLVTATVNGKLELVSLKIEEDLIRSGDVRRLEDLVRAAVNDAHSKAQEAAQGMMQSMMGGMDGMPGLGDLLK